MKSIPSFVDSRVVAQTCSSWRPGGGWEDEGDIPHGEIFAKAGEAAGAALALALAQDRLRSQVDPLADSPDQRPWLWVQDAAALRQGGRPYRPGLPRALRHRLVWPSAASCAPAICATASIVPWCGFRAWC